MWCAFQVSFYHQMALCVPCFFPILPGNALNDLTSKKLAIIFIWVC